MREIRLAKEAGLKVVFVTRVALEHGDEDNAYLWHGLIQPRDEATLDRWFEVYGDFVMRWAEVAEREGVDVFAVGSELNTLASSTPTLAMPGLMGWYCDEAGRKADREAALADAPRIVPDGLAGHPGEVRASFAEQLDAERAVHRGWAEAALADCDEPDLVAVNRRRGLQLGHWRALIARVRSVYTGRLTYAANYDHYPEIGFWDQLDVIGVNAYFELWPIELPLDADEPLDRHLREAWDEHLEDLDAFRHRRGLPDRPVLFTELGYTRRRHCSVHSWASAGYSLFGPADDRHVLVWRDEPVEDGERVAAMRALREVLDARRDDELAPLVGGLLYWKLTTQHSHAAAEPYSLVLGTGDPLEAELTAFR